MDTPPPEDTRWILGWVMMQRLRQQLANMVQRVEDQARNNPMGLLVVTVFTVGFAGWFVRTLWITHNADRWGFGEKTFWDWLELLIVPLILAFGALWFNASQKRTELRIAGEQKKTEMVVAEEARRTEREIAQERQRQATLEAYYKQMADLLLNHGLRKSGDRDEVRSIARATTLAVLRNLDARRKGQVVKFLHESGLINRGGTIISLVGADLIWADLRRTYLREANLNGAMLIWADLAGTNLIEASLIEANLVGADFVGADLRRADLRRASLSGVKLWGANLIGADLRGADLDRARLAAINGAEEVYLEWTDPRGVVNQLLQATLLERKFCAIGGQNVKNRQK